MLSIFIFCILLSLIWFPELKHHYVSTEVIPMTSVESGQTVPSKDVLEELRFQRLLERDWKTDAQLVVTAEKLLKGSVEIPGRPVMNLHLPFDASDLDKGTDEWQLQFSGLIVPEIFIDAYRITGREAFYDGARDSILAWAKYEKGAWLNRGFLWNDHAVAARIRTLVDFWEIYRARADYMPFTAQQILEFASRSGELLAKPDQFTVATNHGVMQNVALWQLCIAFPSLPHVGEYKQIAFARLKSQISFYVSPEGVVLEHSAGYHEFGVFLLGLVLRDATLLNLDVPSDWIRKYEAAQDFYAQIRRPDGTLPPFGDTGISSEGKGGPSTIRLTGRNDEGRFGPVVAKPVEFRPKPFAIYPVSGYAVVWDGASNKGAREDFAQTVLAWSYYPGHGHKHADELGVLLWARGQEWWTNVGYWPYGDPDRKRAECWESSNAPHLVGENCISDRRATLTSSLYSNGLFAAEMDRQGPGGLRIRRLVVHLVPSTWVIVDDCTGAFQNHLQTVWTAAPDLMLKPGATPGAYTLSTNEAKGQLRAYFLGLPSLTIKNFRGSHDHFAGWISVDGRTAPTNAIVTDQPAEGAWAVTVWVFDKVSGGRGREVSAASVEWSNKRLWKIQVALENGWQLISRDGEKISVDGAPPDKSEHLPISETLESPPPGTTSQIDALRASYQVAAAQYPHFKDLSRYRVRASVLGIALFFLQELFLELERRRGGAHLFGVRIIALLAWIGLCVWVPVFYLRAF
jgi:hypothetical protein